MAPLSRALVFIGFMGAGKSTAAAEVAAELGVSSLDCDALLEEQMGHSIAREFEVGGEARFREREESLVCELLQRSGDTDGPTVIALGGGAVLSARVRAALEAHIAVLLDIEPALAWERVRGGRGAGAGDLVGSIEDPAARARTRGRARRGAEGEDPRGESERPLARDHAAFAALHAERHALYEALADAILPADVPGVAVHALPALLALAATRESEMAGGGTLVRGGSRLLWAAAASGQYPVLVGRGLLGAGAPEAVWRLGARTPDSRAFCVTDETVAGFYTPPLRSPHAPIAIPAGEAHKTLASAERVWHELAGAHVTRADHLVALGGGVVGDLAGFCAATYQRGVPVVQAPTTLVAQVDSAYGGKTGVDLPEAKNYVGAYHQPSAVIVDPDALRTLSEAELNAGWVEVLKTALIAGGELWGRVAADQPVDEPMILACARLKLAVVAEDERDGGRRQVLNLGHTIGHAIETATGYGRYRHGEAVGLGLLAALRLSGRQELRAEVRELLLARRLPVALDPTPEGPGVEEILAAAAHDKKRLHGTVPFVLLDAPGAARVGCEVRQQDLHAAVAELADGG
ncbi:MAG TPA: bifunctional shikimate kinase/3-dehydroquinate synthase [Solirubrobacteraceae bacterium]